VVIFRANRSQAPASPREAALEEWRDAAKRVAREYRAWQAAERCDRHRRYVTYLAALRSEEQAAWRVAGMQAASGSAQPT